MPSPRNRKNNSLIWICETHHLNCIRFSSPQSGCRTPNQSSRSSLIVARIEETFQKRACMHAYRNNLKAKYSTVHKYNTVQTQYNHVGSESGSVIKSHSLSPIPSLCLPCSVKDLGNDLSDTIQNFKQTQQLCMKNRLFLIWFLALVNCLQRNIQTLFLNNVT